MAKSPKGILLEDFYEKIINCITKWNSSEKKPPAIDMNKIKIQGFKIIGLNEETRETIAIATTEKLKSAPYLGTFEFADYANWSIHRDNFLTEFTNTWFVPLQEPNSMNYYYWLDIITYNTQEKADSDLILYPPTRKDLRMVCSVQIIPYNIIKLMDCGYKESKLRGIGSRRYKESIFGQYKNKIIIDENLNKDDLSFQLRFIFFKSKIDNCNENYKYIIKYIKKLVSTQLKTFKIKYTDIDEIAEDTFTYLIEKIKDISNPYSIRSYLKKVTKAKILELIRSRSPSPHNGFPISIRSASEKFSIYPKKIYRLLEKGVINPISTFIGADEYLEIDEENFQKLEEYINAKKAFKQLKIYISEKKQISLHSAWKYIDYWFKKGKTIEQIADTFLKIKN